MSEQQSITSALAPSGERSIVRKKAGENLRLDLDFCRISRQEATSTHPHVLFSPVHYEPGYAYPLFVWLHGSGADERQLMRLMPLLSMRNYVAVAPQGLASVEPEPAALGVVSLDVSEIINGGIRQRPQYDWPQTEEAISESERRVFDCISVACRKNNIANHRIFLAGFGSGGSMALRLGLLYPKSFAGVVSIGGAFPQGHLPFRQWNAARNLPIMFAVGEKSTTFSPADACDALELCYTAGLPIVVREYPCGQEIAPAMLQDVNRWIMEQVCG